MKFKNKLMSSEAKNSVRERIAPLDENGRLENTQHSARVFQDTKARPNELRRPLHFISGVALCMCIGSCVFPFEDYNGYGSGYSTYRPGYRVNSLPYGYRSENISGSTYYYYNGYYYRPSSGGYVVVDAPRNSRFYDDYRRRQQSYQSNREYPEAPDRHDGRYDRGEIITRLPDGYRVLNHRGETYYQVGDRYYRRDGEIYVITTRPY